jgi:hypothetical protein
MDRRLESAARRAEMKVEDTDKINRLRASYSATSCSQNFVPRGTKFCRPSTLDFGFAFTRQIRQSRHVQQKWVSSDENDSPP